MTKPKAVVLPHIGDIAFHLLMILGRTTRPFPPTDAYGAVRAVLGDKYNCGEQVWKNRIRTAKDRLVKQGFLQVQEGYWRSTEAGRAEAEVIRRIQDT